MQSGIYKLTFSSGRIYIGKSDNIEKRWEQHRYKFNKGAHASRMQLEFNAYGEPKYEVIFYCHKDHVDLVESIFIQAYAGPYSLNGNIPAKVSEEDEKTLVAHGANLAYSTADHLRHIDNITKKLTEAEKRLNKYKKEGITLPSDIFDIKNENKELLLTVYDQQVKLERYRGMSLWDRLFNYNE